MKKIRILLMVFFVALLLIPCNILAAGTYLSIFRVNRRITGIEPYFMNDSNVSRDHEYEFYDLAFGNYFGAGYDYIEYKFDDDIFEFVSFRSDYDFEYNNGRITLKGNQPLTSFFKEYEPSVLWVVTLKVKATAKLGNTDVIISDPYGGVIKESYSVVCNYYGDNSPECNSNENTNNQTQNPNDNNIPESNVNDNNNENQNANTPIKEETSIFDKKTNLNLYVLLTLFAIISIELLVLIIMVINNSRKRRNSKV